MRMRDHVIAAAGVVLGIAMLLGAMALFRSIKESEVAPGGRFARPPVEDRGIAVEREKEVPGLGTIRVISIDGQRFIVVQSGHGLAIERMEPWDARP